MSKSIPSVPDKILKSIIKCITDKKFNVKCKSQIKNNCEYKNADCITPLFYTKN